MAIILYWGIIYYCIAVDNGLVLNYVLESKIYYVWKRNQNLWESAIEKEAVIEMLNSGFVTVRDYPDDIGTPIDNGNYGEDSKENMLEE